MTHKEQFEAALYAELQRQDNGGELGVYNAFWTKEDQRHFDWRQSIRDDLHARLKKKKNGCIIEIPTHDADMIRPNGSVRFQYRDRKSEVRKYTPESIARYGVEHGVKRVSVLRWVQDTDGIMCVTSETWEIQGDKAVKWVYRPNDTTPKKKKGRNIKR
jgi:hypothetical protein